MNISSPEAVTQSRPGSFDVYIDPPTGYAFVNTPAGWTFTGQVPVGAPDRFRDRSFGSPLMD